VVREEGKGLSHVEEKPVKKKLPKKTDVGSRHLPKSRFSANSGG
jgi:hypothetical protein